MCAVPVKVPCGECQRLFSNKWFLHLHELRVHSEVRRLLSCPREGCDRKFTWRFNLESHVLGDHEGKKPFSCAHPGCGKSFAMKVSLKHKGITFCLIFFLDQRQPSTCKESVSHWPQRHILFHPFFYINVTIMMNINDHLCFWHK